MTEAPSGPAAFEELAQIRQACPALHQVLLPDSDWRRLEAWHRVQDIRAQHNSTIVLALERGHLHRVTSPIHRYLIEGSDLKAAVTAQYRKDLVESWMLHEDEIERHRGSRRFRGRLVELQFAEWLDSNGWRVDGLEALGNTTDIAATSSDGSAVCFEVKFIGQADDDFEALVNSIARQSSVAQTSVYAPANYLLSRVHDAARQLGACNCGATRIAAIVIDEMSWVHFHRTVLPDFLDWDRPEFFHRDGECEEVLVRTMPGISDVDAALQSSLSLVDQVWILRCTSHQISLERGIRLSSR